MPHDPFLNQSQDRGGPAMPSLKAGQWLFNGRYELIRQLGAGGMGVVWLARDHTEETQVALKFLPTVLVLNEGEMKRLKEEVRAGKELRHPGIVATYALEMEDSTAAIVMEYVEGKTLAELLAEQPRGFFEPAEIAAGVRSIAEAVDYLHTKAKRIHRDLKPANIIVSAAGEARLMDFGISQRIQEGVTRHSKTRDGHGDSSSTLAYASPQQLGGKLAAKADDLYSLGATLYELLTGTPPFYRGGADAVAIQIKTEPVTPIHARRAELVTEGANATTGQKVPAAVETAVLACLAKNREQRPASAEKVVQSFSSPKAALAPAAAKRPATTFWAAAALILAALGAWALLSKPKEIIKEVPKLVEDTAAKQEAERHKQEAEDLQKKLREAEQKRLAAEAEAKQAKADAAKAMQPPPAPAPPPLPTRTATKESPFTNSLGMKFVPVPIGAGPSKGQRILFSIWETRSKDYAAFVKASSHDAGEDWKTYSYEDVPVGRGEGERAEESSHPVANVSHDDAVAFCAWLTKKDRASGLIGQQDEYRLPSDVEWSYAVGIGEQEDASASPKDKGKDMKLEGGYPWDTGFPPPAGSGNYADMTAKAKFGSDWNIIEGYTDGYATTAPVGSFKKNALGLYDLGGNLYEWTSSPWESGSTARVVRGGSWFNGDRGYLASSIRGYFAPDNRDVSRGGFRCVVVVSSSSP